MQTLLAFDIGTPARVAMLPVVFVDGVQLDNTEFTYNPTTGQLALIAPLANGTHEVSYAWHDGYLRTGPQSDALVVMVDDVAPGAPTLVRDGSALADGTINIAERDAQGGVVLTGSTEEGLSVSLTIGGQTVAATVNGTTWSYALTAAEVNAMGQGAESITLTAADAAGNTATSTSESFTVDTTTGLVLDAVMTDNAMYEGGGTYVISENYGSANLPSDILFFDAGGGIPGGV